MKMKNLAEKKLLITLIGFLNPITFVGVLVESIPRWIPLIAACIHGGAYARLNFMLKPSSDDINDLLPTDKSTKDVDKEKV